MAGILTYALHYEGAFNKNSLGAVAEVFTPGAPTQAIIDFIQGAVPQS